MRLLTGCLAVATVVTAVPAAAQDRIFHHQHADVVRFDGMPMWAGAAICAAFADQVELRLRLNRDDWNTKLGHMNPEDRANPRYAYPERRDVDGRERARRSREDWKTFGLMRLARDRPGQSAEPIFEARVAEESARFAATPFTMARQMEEFEYSCQQYASAVSDNLTRMQRGWPDRTDGAN